MTWDLDGKKKEEKKEGRKNLGKETYCEAKIVPWQDLLVTMMGFLRKQRINPLGHARRETRQMPFVIQRLSLFGGRETRYVTHQLHFGRVA